MTKRKTLFTDGEGPLVIKDLAFDLAGRIVRGKDLFCALSIYDDYLAEVETEGYQAGDTLALIVVHYLVHGLTDEEVDVEAKGTKLVFGVAEYIDGLVQSGWEIRVISTAYRPMWNYVGEKLGLDPGYIACTELNLQALRSGFLAPDFAKVVIEAEDYIFDNLPLVIKAQDQVATGKSVVEVLGSGDFAGWLVRMNQFYWQDLPKLGYRPLEEVRVMGGSRKVEAAKEFAGELRVGLESIVYVGDSITDCKVFEATNRAGGLTVAVNGNYYALREAQVAVATDDMRLLRPLWDAWQQNGWDGVNKLVRQRDSVYQLPDESRREKFAQILAQHKAMRQKVRGEAAKLG